MFFKKNSEGDNASSLKYLELQVMELKSQIENIKGIAEDSNKQYTSLDKAVSNFCKALLDREYALAQIGDSGTINVLNMNIYELLDYTWKSIEKQKLEANSLLLNIKGELDISQRTIEDLKSQLSQLLVAKDLSKQEIIEILTHKTEPIDKSSIQEKLATPSSLLKEAEISSVPIVKKKSDTKIESKESQKMPEQPVKIIEVLDKDIEDEIIKKNLQMEIKNDDNKNKVLSGIPDVSKEKVISHVIDLNQLMKNMNDVSWKLLEAIGVNGFSEKNDIYNLIKNDMPDVSEATMDNMLMELKASNIIDRERISTGWRNFFVYEMTSTGIRVFKESGKFQGEPVICERRKLIKQHATANHGYLIKDTMLILQNDLNFKDVTYEQSINKVELPNGDIYIPDVTGISPETNEKCYFECELAHHTQVDFNEKLTKMRMVTNNFYFVVPTNMERRKIRRQIDSWMLQRGTPLNIKTYVTTTRNLKKGKWDSDDTVDDIQSAEENQEQNEVTAEN